MYTLFPKQWDRKDKSQWMKASFGQLSNVFCQVCAANQHSKPLLSTPEAEAGASRKVESIWCYIQDPVSEQNKTWYKRIFQ